MSALQIVKGKRIEKFGKPALLVDIKEGKGQITRDVTIYSEDQKGTPFPNFKELKVGAIIDGRLFTNAKGYVSLYANEPRDNDQDDGFTTSSPRRGGGGRAAASREMMDLKEERMTKASERTAERIDRSQDRKELMYARLGATDIVAHHPAYQSLKAAEITETIEALTADIMRIDPNNEADEDGFAQHDAAKRAMDKDDGIDEMEYPEEEINSDDIPFD